MAQVQEYYAPSYPYPSPPQPRLQFENVLDTSETSCGYEDSTQEVTVAQPLLQHPLMPEDQMQSLQWQMSQQCNQSSTSNSSMLSHSQMWAQVPSFDCPLTWGGLPTEPFIMSRTDHSTLANNDLLYSHDAKEHIPGKSFHFNGSSLWGSNGMNNHHCGDMMPSPSADVLLSPVSPSSDAKRIYGSSPENGLVSSSGSSASYTTSPGVMKVSSSPGFAPSTPQSISRIPAHLGNAAIQHSFGMDMPPAGKLLMSNTTEPLHYMAQYDSEHSYDHSQDGSPGMTPWYPPGYTSEQSAMVRSSQRQELSTSRLDTRPNSFMTFNDGKSRQRQAQWSNGGGVPAQRHFQTRFMAPSTADTDAVRKADDETLLQMKQNGCTYKDIRKALRRKVAESTLRGRYRSLTKPKRERLRAPKWTEVDIMLLKRYVQDEFDRLDVTQPSLETKQKPDKIPWMKIVDTIATTGGSYKFGVATAKKKWIEVTCAAPARSSRRRSQI